jgi:hypothetical protein
MVPPTDPEHDNGHVVLFKFFKIPMVEWPNLVQRNDEHVFTREVLEHCRDKVNLSDPQWIRAGFNSISQAVKTHSRTTTGRIPQVDLKGVRRR